MTDDFWPMWAITQPFRLSQWRSMNRRDPLDPALLRDLDRAYRAAVEALQAEPLRREQFTEVLRHHTPRELHDLPQRGLSRHFMAIQPLVQVPEPGERYGRARYTTAEAWLGPAREAVDLDVARTTLLRRHLTAFGPATVEDALTWIGRGRGAATPWRTALEGMRDELVELQGPDGERLVDLASAPRPGEDAPAPARLLARWDSILLAHRIPNRARVLPAAHHAAVNMKNADVLPTFLVDGFVAGTWEPPSPTHQTAVLTLRPFGRLARAWRDELEAEADAAARFLAPHAADVAIGWG